MKIFKFLLFIFNSNAFFFKKSIKQKIITRNNSYANFVDNHSYIYLKLSGKGDGMIADKITDEFIKVFAKSCNNIDVLINMNDAISANRFAIQNTILFARYHYSYFGKIAVVTQKRSLLRYVWIVNFAVDQLQIKAFTNETKALDWLKSKKPN
jgi:hypothetical protein